MTLLDLTWLHWLLHTLDLYFAELYSYYEPTISIHPVFRISFDSVLDDLEQMDFFLASVTLHDPAGIRWPSLPLCKALKTSLALIWHD